MSKRSRKYKKKLKKYAKTTRRYIDNGVKIWNRLNSNANRKTMRKATNAANRISDNLRNIL